MHAEACDRDQGEVTTEIGHEGIEMGEREVIEALTEKWNAQADQHNRWDELGCDEKLELVADRERAAST
ncbi:hypothetical protein P9281_02315 [Caballeronia sp. LP003]|uniref:hypothetical protein n=1 Tax=Caballeronia sp. LP003 TaxID=3038551 RepID=UPI00286287AB|nr:hypothetical protein [Caballeronia sp. LP003]MDR5785389.1 hypothetical protein [Caballeronia sp. LP003]